MPAEIETNLGDSVKRVRHIIVRRRWWVIISACITPVVTIGVLSHVPNRYTSEATLLVVQQQVPQRYVVPNSTPDVASELQAMKQEILSRPHLNTVIQEFGLYPKERRRLAPEQIIEKMIRDID